MKFPVYSALLPLLAPTFFALSTLPLHSAPPTEGKGSEAPKRIVVGSCHTQHFHPSRIWKTIQNENPDLLLLLGDNVYIDSYKEEKHRAAYKKLKEVHGFQHVLQSLPTLAIWDDHDYGRNDDGGDDNPEREMAQKIFLEEFEIPPSRGPWKRPGIYDSYLLGTPPNTVQVLLLDTRSFRDPLLTHPKGKRTTPEGFLLGKYTPQDDPNTTLLGKAQWKWLEKELKKPAKIRLIASSTQILSNEHGWECWGNFPHEREKLLNLLKKTSGSLLLLSGDRHFSEVSKKKTPTQTFYEITTSPLLSKAFEPKEPNPYRVGNPVSIPNYALLTFQEDSSVKVEFKSSNGKSLKTLSLNLE